MRYLLDTNVCVDYLTGLYPSVVARIQRSRPEDLCLSTVVVAELRYGADHSTRRRTNHARVDALIDEMECLDFDFAGCGRLRAQLEAQGTPIGPNDMLIAAQALERALTVVTDNVAEFGRVKGPASRAGGNGGRAGLGEGNNQGVAWKSSDIVERWRCPYRRRQRCSAALGRMLTPWQFGTCSLASALPRQSAVHTWLPRWPE